MRIPMHFAAPCLSVELGRRVAVMEMSLLGVWLRGDTVSVRQPCDSKYAQS